MLKKMKLKKRIKRCKKRIEVIEKKRTRSQAALVEAILTNSVPNDSDVDYFNQFTGQINAERDELHRLQDELKSL